MVRDTRGRAAQGLALIGGVIVVAALLLVLTGCDKEPGTGFGADIGSPESVVQGELVVGTPDDTALALTVCNRTGQAVSAVEFKLTTEEYYGKPFVSQEWNTDQNLKLYFSPTQFASPKDKFLLIDARLTFADGSVFEITGFDLYAMKDANLRIDAQTELAYLESVNALGAQVSTLGNSIAVKAAEQEAQRLAEELAQAEAEAAAADADAQTQAPPQAQPSNGYGYGADPGVGSGSGGVTQTDDSCLDGVIVN